MVERAYIAYLFDIFSQYNLSVESNQNVESKRKSVESKMGKLGVQLLTYLQFYNSRDCYVIMVTSIFIISSAFGVFRPRPPTAALPHSPDLLFCGVQKSLNYTMIFFAPSH